ncbi:MAG: hypothetical protein RIB59_05100 [Rhodospirillales bacterium]
MTTMHKKLKIPILAALAGVFVLIGAPGPAAADTKIEKEAQEAYRDVKEYGFEKKEDAIAWLKKRQMAIEIKLKQLKQQAEKGGDKVKKNWDKTVAALEKQKNAAAQKAEKLTDSTKDAWEDAKDSVVATYKDLEQAVDAAAEKL